MNVLYQFVNEEYIYIYMYLDVYWCGSAWLTEVILMDSVANDYSRCYPSHLGVPPVQSSLSWYHCAWWYLEQPVILHLFIYKPMYINVHQCTSMYINVHQCTSMYINVHQCTSMYINVHQCTSMYIFRGIPSPFLWCFLLFFRCDHSPYWNMRHGSTKKSRWRRGIPTRIYPLSLPSNTKCRSVFPEGLPVFMDMFNIDQYLNNFKYYD